MTTYALAREVLLSSCSSARGTFGHAPFGLADSAQHLARLGDARARLLHVERQGGVGGRVERARRQPAAEEGHLVGQADAGERALGALGTVHQRRGQAGRGGGEPQLRDGGAGAGAQRLVEHDALALARAGVPDCALVHGVARVLQDQRLGADLHALGLAGALGHVRALALLGVDGRDAAVLPLDEIHPGDDAERLGGERHRAGGEVWLLVGRVRRRQPAAAGIDPHVRAPTLLGVTGVSPFAVHPFQEGEARAVDPLVDHAHRDERSLHPWQAGRGAPG